MEMMPNLPPDLTFLSQVLYEGLLQYYRYGSLYQALEKVSKTLPENAKLYIAGNDLSMIKKGKLRVGFPEQLLMYLDPNKYTEQVILHMVEQKSNYTNLMAKEFVESLLNTANLKNLTINSSDLSIEIKSSEMIIGGKKEITAPQIMKIDRYTGFSSLETRFTSRQITIFLSASAALLFLIGLYSSFVMNIYSQGTQYYYFLFYYPEEELNLLLQFNTNLMDIFFILKDTVREVVRDILKYTTFNELLLLELALNMRIHELMINENLDKLALNLLKIAKEGQTYKIYEHTPITLFKEPYFLKHISSYVRDTDAFINNLSKILAPGEVLLDALKNNWVESDNILEALRNLYRFIMLGDAQGLFEFINGLNKAYIKIRNTANKKDSWRIPRYANIIRSFAYIR